MSLSWATPYAKALTMKLYMAASLVAAAPVLLAQTYTCPSAGMQWQVEAPLTNTNVTITDLAYDGLQAEPTSSGRMGTESGHTGNYAENFTDSGAIGWVLSCPLATHTFGMCSVTGFARADIAAGVGNANVYAGGKSDVAYCAVTAHAQDEKTVNICSAGAPIGVGGQVQMFGFGGGFNAVVTPDQAAATSAALAGADSKGWLVGNQATVTIVTNTYGNISLVGAASDGEISGEANGGARVVFKKVVPPDEEG